MKIKLLCLFLCLIVPLHGFATPNGVELSKKMRAIEEKTNTIIGIAAIYIEKNQVIEYKGRRQFFMASTIKLPIAMAFLHRVDEKKDSLSRLIRLDTRYSVPGSGTLYHLFERKMISMSLGQLLKYMLCNSDNSASDAILQAATGPQYVTNLMRSLGLNTIYVNRSIIEMFLDTNHVDHTFLKNRRPVYALEKTFNRVPLEHKMLAWQRFEKDKRDTTTPYDMAKLLEKLYKNQVLSKSNTQLLIGIMEKCRTGRNRIKGLLPAHVKVAHKTGTWAIYEQKYLRYPGSKQLFRFASDVGIITLPNNKGHIAIAVYVKSRSANDHIRNRAIALASRTIYEQFMHTSLGYK